MAKVDRDSVAKPKSRQAEEERRGQEKRRGQGADRAKAAWGGRDASVIADRRWGVPKWQSEAPWYSPHGQRSE